MVYVVAKSAFSVGANAKSAEQVDGQYQFVEKGMLNLYALASVTGLNASLKINGVSIIDDQPLIMFGATGGLNKEQNEAVSQTVAGGRVELLFRNTTGGAITVDYILEFIPTGR